jgi:hypothetical protein
MESEGALHLRPAGSLGTKMGEMLDWAAATSLSLSKPTTSPEDMDEVCSADTEF